MSWRAAVTTATHGCSPQADDVFGPVVGRECRGGFDLTLLFEQAVLSIIPAAIIIVAFPLRFAYLATARPKSILHPARFFKLFAASVFLLLQVALLVLWSRDEVNRTRASLPLAVLNVIVGLQLVVLSWMEDGRSIRPSTMLGTYLAITVILDIAQARTLWLRHLSTPIAAVFSATVAVKAVMLLLESRKKTTYLKQAHADLPPEATSGIINRSFLWWLNDLFRRGLSTHLTLDDLYPLDDELASGPLSTKIQQAWSRRRKPERRFEFPLAAWRALRWHILSAIVPRLFLIAFTFAQPFLISRVLDLLSEPDSQPARNVGYSLILAAAVIYMGLTLSTLYYNHSVYRFMTMFRGASVALIFNHMLTLPLGEYDDSAVVTLMSTDVDRIVLCLISLNEIWARVIEVAVGVVLLARQLGWVCLVPLFVVVVSFFGSAEISRTIGARQKVWIDAVQQRITITASMLAEMRSVKMMGLSPVLSAIVQDQRVQETRRMAASRWSIVWQNVVQNLPWALAPSLTFIIYVAQATARGSSSIDVTQAFTALSIITLLTDPAAKLLSAIPSTAASLGCFDRIQEFLVARPRTDPRFVVSPSRTTQGQEAATISMQNMSLRPVATAEPVLTDVNFAIARGSLAMVVGPVGSGKTTLIKGILGEVKDQNGGSVRIASKQVALCVQVPWLPNTTIREAISGYVEEGQSVDQAWYRKCLHACALDYDLDRLADGEDTLVGSASTVLSGGQRARVALARAVYARTDIVLLDDVLGALDTNTQATIMSRLFGSEGLLKKRNVTVVLATHATEFLKYADKVLIVSDGRVKDGGKGDGSIPKELINALKATSSPSADQVEPKEPNAKDRAEEIAEANEVSDMNRSEGDLDVYRYYFKSVGWPKTALFVGFVIVDVFCSSFSTIWLKWWAEVDGGQIALYMSVYVALAFLTSVGTGGYVWSILILISPYTARKLHAVLLRVVMRAPQSFFSATDSGSILNRFSQDMTIIEGQLPIGILIAVSNLFSSLAAAALVTTGSVYMVVSVPFLVFTIWALQHVYLHTSRQLRLLDLESKSPLYSHFLETVGGLATIRAFGWQSRFKAKNERLLDYSQRPHYLLYCSQRWLNLVLDLIVGAQAVLVVGLAVGLRRSTSPGLLGVSLNSTLSFSGALSSLVSGWTMLETSLGSIARLMSFEATVKPEDKPGETYQPPPSWPERGAVEFRQVTAVHSPGAVGICEVSLEIKPGQKVGVCGRTGSGKSSLVATLVRLLEMDSGSIFIDGVDVATVPRETIRERLVSLPQDPLVLNGSVRLNVDPEERSTDEAVATALDRVGLGDFAQSRGIMADITATSLSRGEQQLLALARAVVKKQACGSTILLLDEATSNVDAETDAVLQRILREDFSGCTRVAVAHRIETIMDSDVIVVMDSGRIVEVGAPSDLLHKEDGWFAQLAGSKE
ncbi:hypothetical protein JDV02_008955 [Purpureocillium takamizusanense]|uniref:ABC transporter n=1 Tax=Purpureocillium takamizusanense TaxID=2060973 RepID=A0A9Q8VFT0_9HYPO|nr:uncharacterized protein JDV02_008955 [Purpureocillium takamizusanense]UNI23117.1 hypothetical protein JDV02_008955 [Purpureocillium takamizusanense]